MAKRGEGIHHIAVRVDNIEEALERLKAAGARLIDSTPAARRAQHTNRIHSSLFNTRSTYWSSSNMANDIRIGIIGGSGLYQMAGLTEVEEVEIDTPFGKPSDAYRIGTLEGRRVAFLARHNRNHTILPSELNFRANIYGFKKLGVEWISRQAPSDR